MSMRLSLREEVEPPLCSSCGKIMHPREKGAIFNCPNCGEITIYRDLYCRLQGVEYVCPKCGFVGP